MTILNYNELKNFKASLRFLDMTMALYQADEKTLTVTVIRY
jgi:hypothetical protein